MGSIQDEIEDMYYRARREEAARQREQEGNKVLSRTRELFQGIGKLDNHIEMKVAELEGLILRYIRGG